MIDVLRSVVLFGMSLVYNFLRFYILDEFVFKFGGDEVKKYEVELEWFVYGKSCLIKCVCYVEVEYKGKKICVKFEYESIVMFGVVIGVFDFFVVVYFIYFVNDYGMDSIVIGVIIGWFFEMVERGLISEDEIGFFVKGFGDVEVEERFIKLMVERKGIGVIFVDGVKRVCERFGRGCEFVVYVKGMESLVWDLCGRRIYGFSYVIVDVGVLYFCGWLRFY